MRGVGARVGVRIRVKVKIRVMVMGVSVREGRQEAPCCAVRMSKQPLPSSFSRWGVGIYRTMVPAHPYLYRLGGVTVDVVERAHVE